MCVTLVYFFGDSAEKKKAKIRILFWCCLKLLPHQIFSSFCPVHISVPCVLPPPPWGGQVIQVVPFVISIFSSCLGVWEGEEQKVMCWELHPLSVILCCVKSCPCSENLYHQQLTLIDISHCKFVFRISRTFSFTFKDIYSVKSR